MRFELGVGHFDGVQVWAVGREKEHPASLCFQDVLCVSRLVGRQIVGDHHVAGLQGGGELGLDIGVKRGAVHRSIEHPGRAELVDAQARDEGLGALMTKGGVGLQPGSSR